MLDTISSWWKWWAKSSHSKWSGSIFQTFMSPFFDPVIAIVSVKSTAKHKVVLECAEKDIWDPLGSRN